MKLVVKSTSYLRHLSDDFEIQTDLQTNLVFDNCDYGFLDRSNGLMIVLGVKDRKGDVKKLCIPTSDVLAIFPRNPMDRLPAALMV